MRKHWIAFTLVLVGGFVLGSAFGVFVLGHRLPWGPDKAGHEHLVRKFSRKLDLTSEQRDRVAAILEAKRARLESLRSESGPRFEEIRISARNEIRSVLTPDQQLRFDRMVSKWEERRKRRGPRHPPF